MLGQERFISTRSSYEFSFANAAILVTAFCISVGSPVIETMNGFDCGALEAVIMFLMDVR